MMTSLLQELRPDLLLNTTPTHLLLIWELIPEETEYYLVKLSELSKEELDNLMAINNKYINQCGLTNKDKLLLDTINKNREEGKYIQVETPITGHLISIVINSGFFL